jgi:hypothetical protein
MKSSRQFITRLTGPQESHPGPSDYSTPRSFGSDAPTYTLKGRPSLPVKESGVPYLNIPSTIGNGPKFTFHQRPTSRRSSSIPGPTYFPPDFGKDANKFTLHQGTGIESKSDNPGPGAYDVPPLFSKDANKFTLHQRAEVEHKSNNLGPGAYSPKYEATQESVQASTFHFRPEI